MRPQDWRATCNKTGVRIPSAAMTSTTVPPLPQSSAHVSSFQSIFKGASQQSAPAPEPMDPHAKIKAVEAGASKNASEQGATQSPSGTSADTSAIAVRAVNGERWHAISVESYVSVAAKAILPGVVQPPLLPIQANLFDGTLPIAPATATIAGASEIGVIRPDRPDANSPAVESTPNRVASKPEKPKATPALDKVGLLAAVNVAVVDQSSAPIRHVFSGQGNGREQGGESSGASAKAFAANAPKGLCATPAEPLAATPDGEGNAKIIPQGQQPFEAVLATQGTGDSLIASTGVPLPSGPPSNAEVIVPVGRATPKGGFDAVASRSSDPPAPPDIEKNVTTGPGSAALRSAQSDRQVSQGSQVDPSKSVTITGKVPDSGAPQLQLQTQTVAVHAATHETPAAQHVPTTTADTARAAKSPEAFASINTAGDEPVASSGINAAKLIQSMGESEMRVGMHSTEFGDISIRTTISQQQMVTQISLSHSDLSQAISAHVATVQAKLGEDYGLHASIEINHQGSSLSGDSGSAAQPEQRSPSDSTGAKSTVVPEGSGGGINLGSIASVGTRYGLDIRI